MKRRKFLQAICFAGIAAPFAWHASRDYKVGVQTVSNKLKLYEWQEETLRRIKEQQLMHALYPPYLYDPGPVTKILE